MSACRPFARAAFDARSTIVGTIQPENDPDRSCFGNTPVGMERYLRSGMHGMRGSGGLRHPTQSCQY